MKKHRRKVAEELEELEEVGEDQAIDDDGQRILKKRRGTEYRVVSPIVDVVEENGAEDEDSNTFEMANCNTLEEERSKLSSMCTTPAYAKMAERCSSAHLVVTPAKVREVKQWIVSCIKSGDTRPSIDLTRLLVLRGPPGCGKTTMIRALTEELKVDLVGWTFPVTLKSAADDLRSLASETSYPSVVDKSSTRRMLLLDDLPEVLPLKIRYEIVHVVTSLGVPIIAIFSEVDRSVPAELLAVSTVVTLRAVAPTRMKKALQLAVSNMQSVEINSKMLEELTLEAGGDLRAAVNALQAVSVAPSSAMRSLTFPLGDSRVISPHMAAKILHANRLENGELKDKPENLCYWISNDSDFLQSYLFSNMHEFFMEPEDAANALEGLSFADVLYRWREGDITLAHLRQTSLCVAAYSIIACNYHPAKKSFKPLRSSQDFETRQAAEAIRKERRGDLRYRASILDYCGFHNLLPYEMNIENSEDDESTEDIADFDDSESD